MTEKRVLKTGKKKKTRIRFKKNLVRDFGKEFGELNSKNGGKLQGELLFHGEFAVPMNSSGLVYYFTDYDENFEYELTDDVPMNKIEGRMDRIVSGFKKTTSVPSFAKSMKKGLFHLKAEVLDGQPTSYYISERYGQISFRLKKNAKTEYYLRVALDKKDRIHPGSVTWLTYKDVK